MGGSIHNMEMGVCISVSNSEDQMLLKAALERPGQRKRVFDGKCTVPLLGVVRMMGFCLANEC